ncbi:MAG TPA: hypothetical protein VN901_23260 [Candidatus Acidoferrales bacterium]|nr:hypothetical protein [Candidatus Acidoferrales bacterium]
MTQLASHRELELFKRLRRIAKYGPGSEKLSNLQLQLLEEKPGVSKQEVQAESEREALSAPEGEKKRKRQTVGHRLPDFWVVRMASG